MRRKTLREHAEEQLELAAQEVDSDIKKARIQAALYYFKRHAEESSVGTERYMADLRMARIEPWDEHLNPDNIIQDTNDVDDILAKNILSDLQKRGISYVRITAQSPEDYVVRSLAKLIGPLTPSQNDFRGEIKLIEPKVGGRANSGDTAADLGLHVDGTQEDETPAVLIFHYIAGAKVGANSIFVDTARALLDIDEDRRHHIVVNLARSDAARFSKKDMVHTGPVFYFSQGSLVCRLRFDEVIQVHPDCQSSYEYLLEMFNEPRYRLEFKPREGDIIVFDNWRVMHARDEVFGMRVRRHWRAWVSNLKPILQPEYYLGIRPFSPEIAARIRAANLA